VGYCPLSHRSRPGVLLRGLDPPVAEAVLHDDDVGTAGEQPRRVRGPQIVERHRVPHLGLRHHGAPVLSGSAGAGLVVRFV